MVCLSVILLLVNEIDDAFSIHSVVLSAFSFLGPNHLPDQAKDVLNYGIHQANVLSLFYGSEKVDIYEGNRNFVPPNLGDQALIENELLAFRNQLFIMKRKGFKTLLSVYKTLAEDEIMQESYSTILQLYKPALLVPQSTAVVERGFSAMNDICTDLRSSLGQQSLDSLMRINLWQNQLTEQYYETIVNVSKDKNEFTVQCQKALSSKDPEK